MRCGRCIGQGHGNEPLPPHPPLRRPRIPDRLGVLARARGRAVRRPRAPGARRPHGRRQAADVSRASAPGIRWRLSALVLAAAIPAALLAAALLVHDYRRDRQQLERDVVATARAMAAATERELVSITRAAQVLATSRRVHEADLSAFYQQAQEIGAL